MRRYGLRELRQGQRVLVRVGRGPKGLTATEIHLAPEIALTGSIGGLPVNELQPA